VLGVVEISLITSSWSPETALYITLSIVTAFPPAVIMVSAIARPPPGALETGCAIVLVIGCDASPVSGFLIVPVLTSDTESVRA
jgi:hypothetical protein